MSGPVDRWFEEQGWEVFGFQREAWDAYAAGRSGLIHAPTGMGKTYAAWLGPVIEALDDPPTERSTWEPIRVLWLTPLRALAADTVQALRRPIADLGLGWTVESRTGDTSASVKARQRDRLPTALVTTPESLSILLSYPGARERFASLRCVVCDEWHELLSTKRGVQAELGLARLRTIAPGARTWGLSATLANLDQAAAALVGPASPKPPLIIRGLARKDIRIETLLPDEIERFPWAGHLGIKLAPAVAERIRSARTTLVFTNTRSQAELWFRALMRTAPDLVGAIGLHHGSIDRDIRAEVETLLRGADRAARSKLRAVVCTSSLDLGVDFSPVDQVIQIGSPKGVARLVQRAGRSGHRPGVASTVVCVPTNALELLEFAAARDQVHAGVVEAREPLEQPLDVLTQHIVTASMGEPFDESALLAEVRSTYAFRALTDAAWSWALDFAGRGGPALEAYPDYVRLQRTDDGRWAGPARPIATRHRMSIGTITSDQAVTVRYGNGRTLGSIEESFITRLRVGDRFVFGGRVLQLKRLKDMTATVERARSGGGAVPRWAGGKMPLSSRLAEAVLTRLDRAHRGDFDGPEMARVRPLLELQQDRSRLPTPDVLLIELVRSRLGHHAFLYPFAGRLAHEGLAAVLAHRLSTLSPRTVRASVNDFGIELWTDEPLDLDGPAWRRLLAADALLDDVLASINSSQLARRAFRGIARIAGLVHQGFPGRATPTRQLQASSDLFYDVFRDFDPDNLLLRQAEREVAEGSLDVARLRGALERLATLDLAIERPPALTPMAFPLFAESLRTTTVSSETWEVRVRKLVGQLEAAAPAAAVRA